MNKKDYSKCLFCGSDRLIKRLIYKTDYAPCLVCKCKKISIERYTYTNTSNPTCRNCKTSTPHEYWPKKTPDKYYYECENCNARIYEKES